MGHSTEDAVVSLYFVFVFAWTIIEYPNSWGHSTKDALIFVLSYHRHPSFDILRKPNSKMINNVEHFLFGSHRNINACPLNLNAVTRLVHCNYFSYKFSQILLCLFRFGLRRNSNLAKLPLGCFGCPGATNC